MRLIIDAYNVLKAGKSKDLHVGESATRQFLDLVRAYAQLKHHEPLVIFDGGTSRWPERFTINGVKVAYSGSQASADHLIIEELARCKHPEDVAVVSSDREICDFAQARSIICIEALGFTHYMHAEIEKSQKKTGVLVSNGKKTQAIKRAGHESSAELDRLMEESTSRVPLKDESNNNANKKQKKNKLSKVERKLKAIIKKL